MDHAALARQGTRQAQPPAKTFSLANGANPCTARPLIWPSRPTASLPPSRSPPIPTAAPRLRLCACRPRRGHAAHPYSPPVLAAVILQGDRLPAGQDDSLEKLSHYHTRALE